MLNIKYTLSDGRIIILSSYHASASYENLLEGEVTLEITKRAIDQKKCVAEKLWPGEPVFLLNNYNSEVLPEVSFIGKFISPDSAVDPNKMASSLVIIWFGNSALLESESLNINALNWADDARDFNW